MKQGKLRPWFRMLGMTILGSAIFALGFDLFLLPNQINIGGVSGIGMLLQQGVEAFHLFTGKDMPAQEVMEKFFS